MTVRFDDSLGALARAIASRPSGAATLSRGVALRDATGRLGFFSADPIEDDEAASLRGALQAALGPYARSERILVLPDDIGAMSVLTDPGVLAVRVDEFRVRLLDRRLVGADWLRRPVERAPGPPRFVFSSLKGGVGRTTALAVVAAHLAAQGKRVLVVDLDLESPGLGPMLMLDEHLPRFGMADALVENGLGELDDQFYVDLTAAASFRGFDGRVSVLPAFGSGTLTHPANVLAKIARAYAEDVGPDGDVVTLMDQIRNVIDKCAGLGGYNAVLVDARSGLHETTAAAILGLGAEVFLFGVHERQTLHGYEALFAHLSQFVAEGELPEWLDRLNAVHAKAPVTELARAPFADQWRDLVNTVLLGRIDDPLDEEHDIRPELPVQELLSVLRNDQYEAFSPLDDPAVLQSEVFRSTFGDLIDRIDETFDALRTPAAAVQE